GGRTDVGLILSEHKVPAAVITLPCVADLLVLLPAAVLQLHTRPAAVGDESHFYLRRDLPTRRAPGEGYAARRLIRRHLPDVVFRAVAVALVEAAADAAFDAHVRQDLATEGRPLRPPLADLFTEHFEGRLWRALHPDRLAEGHSCSPFCSTCRLKASRARPQNWPTSWRCAISSVTARPPVGASS